MPSMACSNLAATEVWPRSAVSSRDSRPVTDWSLPLIARVERCSADSMRVESRSSPLTLHGAPDVIESFLQDVWNASHRFWGCKRGVNTKSCGGGLLLWTVWP